MKPLAMMRKRGAFRQIAEAPPCLRLSKAARTPSVASRTSATGGERGALGHRILNIRCSIFHSVSCRAGGGAPGPILPFIPQLSILLILSKKGLSFTPPRLC